MLDLSIIIPIYNTPIEALERCLRSAKTLSIEKYEVLLIDDGSQPFIKEFCTEYIKNEPAFRYHYKENGGVSSARNFGLEQARGQYVMFVDADDEIIGQPITQEQLRAEQDLILFDMYLNDHSSAQVWASLPCEAGPINTRFFLKQLMVSKSLNSPCVKMFRKELIDRENLRFRTDMVTAEDWLFVCSFARKMQTAQYVKQPCYRYFREESSSQNRTARFPDAMIDNHRLAIAVKREVAKEGLPDWTAAEVMGPAASMHIEDMFNTAAELLLFKMLTKERKQKIRNCALDAKQELKVSGTAKAKLKCVVLLYFPILLWPLAKLRGLYLKLKH